MLPVLTRQLSSGGFSGAAAAPAVGAAAVGAVDGRGTGRSVAGCAGCREWKSQVPVAVPGAHMLQTLEHVARIVGDLHVSEHVVALRP
jgi:hypothetical protein